MFDLTLIAFPGAPNLPVFAGQDLGFFEAQGIALYLETTPSSGYQAKALMEGKCQIAGTAFDNVVAYREGQGAVTLDGPADFVAILSATRLELSLVAGPRFQSLESLRGEAIALDALATGFAFVLYHQLEAAGVPVSECELLEVGATPQRFEAVLSGSHAATLTIEPFTSLARAKGLNVLASSLDSFDAYQGGVFATRKAWLEDNGPIAEKYIRAYLQGLDWTLNPDNRDAAAECLMRHMPAIRATVVEKVLDNLLSPKSGLIPLGSVDYPGVETVLKLRQKYGAKDSALSPAAAYFELGAYEAVL